MKLIYNKMMFIFFSLLFISCSMNYSVLADRIKKKQKILIIFNKENKIYFRTMSTKSSYYYNVLGEVFLKTLKEKLPENSIAKVDKEYTLNELKLLIKKGKLRSDLIFFIDSNVSYSQRAFLGRYGYRTDVYLSISVRCIDARNGKIIALKPGYMLSKKDTVGIDSVRFYSQFGIFNITAVLSHLPPKLFINEMKKEVKYYTEKLVSRFK